MGLCYPKKDSQAESQAEVQMGDRTVHGRGDGLGKGECGQQAVGCRGDREWGLNVLGQMFCGVPRSLYSPSTG